MAPINPAIQPTNDPSYGSNSRPVDVPDVIKVRGVEQNTIMPEGVKQGDRSAEFEGQAAAYGVQADAVGVKGIGELFAGLAQTGDFMGKVGVEMVKKDIEDRVYTTASEIRQAYTTKLEELRQNPAGIKGVLDATNGGETVPDDISTLSENLIALRGAKDAGKISNTYYQGRLLAEAKDLRARYPGFRQEIDNEFAKVTGSNPANAYVQSLVGDINKAAAALNGNRGKMETYLRGFIGYPGGKDVYNGFINGTVTQEQAIDFASKYEAEDVEVKRLTNRMKVTDIGREEKSYVAEKLVDKASGVIVGRAADEILNQLGLNNEQSVVEMASKINNDATVRKNWETLGQNAENMKLRLRTEMIAAADRSGATENIKGGKKALIEKIDASLSIFDTIKDRIYNKDAGGLFSVARGLKEMTDNDTRDLFNDSKVGPEARQWAVMKGFGESFMANYALKQLGGDTPKQYTQFVNRWKRALITQAEYGPRGEPVTLNNAFDEFRDKKVVDPKVSASVINEITRITDKDTPDEAKANLALSAFSPGNRGFISRLNEDGVDAKGRRIQGQNAVFQKLTTPEMTAEIARLGKTNPAIWENYVNWTKETFGSELLNKELNNLKTITNNPNLKVSWDSDNKRFGLAYDSGFREGMTSRQNLGSGIPNADPAYNLALQSINRINSNLYNYKNVAQASGQDVDAFLLRVIRDTAGPDAINNVSGIPAQMINQIDLTRSFEGRFKGGKK